MTEYYEEQARQEMFEEHWVKRSEYNELSEKYKTLQADRDELLGQLRQLEYSLERFDALQDEMALILPKLLGASNAVARSASLIEERVELEGDND